MTRKKGKILFWFACATGAVIVLLTIVSFFASRYIDSEQTQEKIHAMVTDQLGEGVKFQRASLSLFLRPRLVFHRVTISILGATSGSAESVSIYPRLLPLLVGKFSIAKFRAVSPDFILVLSDTPEQPLEEQERVSYSQVKKDLASILASMRLISPDLGIEVKQGKLAIRKGSRTRFIAQSVRGRISLTPDGFGVRVSANIASFGPVSLRGVFSMDQGRMIAHDMQATALDSTLMSVVELRGSSRGLCMADITVDGTIGRKTAQWVAKTFRLPPEQTIRAPLVLSNARFIWKTQSDISLTGSISIKNGPSVSFHAARNPEEFHISRLVIQDEESTASLSFRHTKSVLDFIFQGNLKERTLERMFEGTASRRGWIRGDLRAHVLLGRPAHSSAQGVIEGANFFLPISMMIPIKIDDLALTARNKKVTIRKGDFTWGDAQCDLKGTISVAGDGLHVDLDVVADELRLENILHAFTPDEKKEDLSAKEQKPGYPPLQGAIRIDSKYLSYGNYRAAPLRADVLLDEQGFHVSIIKSAICGISLPGSLTKTDKGFHLNFKPIATKQPLELALACLWGENNTKITGTFDLKADLQARGKGKDLLHGIQGEIAFLANKGEIHRYPLLARILSVLNVTSAVRGRFSDFGEKSFVYNSMTIKGVVQDGKLVLHEAAIDGPAMNLTGRGEINIGDNKIDITVLAAPFKSIDTIVGSIPVVGTVLDKTLITIPIKVSGNLDDPIVTPLSPTAFGEGAMGIIKRTLQLPYKLIQPFLPEEKKPGH